MAAEVAVPELRLELVIAVAPLDPIEHASKSLAEVAVLPNWDIQLLAALTAEGHLAESRRRFPALTLHDFFPLSADCR
jgi:hypothetical protein